MLRLIPLVLSALFLVGSTAATVLPATAAPFRQVRVVQATSAPGQEQSLAVELAGQAATTTILRLTVTYPDGSTQEVLDQTLGSTATLTWQVPATVAGGIARFDLKTSSCGCGDRSSTALPAEPESSITGYFLIEK